MPTVPFTETNDTEAVDRRWIRPDQSSGSGDGRHLVDLDPRWVKIGREALRLREQSDQPSHYVDPVERGRDAYNQLVWIVEDGIKLGLTRS